MRINDGDFLLSGRGLVPVPRAKVHAGWGREVSVNVVGDDLKPLPDSVAVLFFSYLENKFYRALITLPRDSIARLFQSGYPSPGEPSGRGTYRVLVLGVAPGGAVAVWASGRDRQVEVFFGRAEPIDLDWHRAFGASPEADRHEFVNSSLQEAARSDPMVAPMMAHVPTAGRWAGYRVRYRWRPVFDGIGAPHTLEQVEFVNGERDDLVLPLGQAVQHAGLPAPRLFIFEDPQSGQRYRPAFDEDEITAAFARAGAQGRPIELVFTPPTAGALDPQVSVRGAAGTIHLEHVAYIR